MAVDRCAGMARPRAAAERGRLWCVHRRSGVVAERRRGSTMAPASGGMPGRSVRGAAGGTADPRAGRAARRHRGRQSSRADGGLASGSRQCRAERSRERWNLASRRTNAARVRCRSMHASSRRGAKRSRWREARALSDRATCASAKVECWRHRLCAACDAGSICKHSSAQDRGRERDRCGATRAQLLAACESLAIAQAVLDATRQHLAGRDQFGQPILRFQAVQHRLVGIYLRIRELQALLAAAQAAYDEATSSSTGCCGNCRRRRQPPPLRRRRKASSCTAAWE